MNILVAKNGSQLGPFSESDIHAKLASGELVPTDLGWKEGMAAWTPLSQMLPTPPAAAPAAPPPPTYSPPAQNNPAPYTPPQNYAPQGQPQQNYAPQPYNAPQGQYNAPQGQYNAPQGQYNAPQGQYSAPQTYNSPYPAPYQQGATQQWGAPSGVVYAGFWLRFVATLIDGLLLAIPGWVLNRLALSSSSDPYIFSTHINGQFYGYTWAYPINFLIALAYYAVMESSAKQASVGKLALGLKVTDLNGNRLSLGRAAARYIAQFLSWWTLTIGFMMAGFTQRKQALHDMVAGALVVKK